MLILLFPLKEKGKLIITVNKGCKFFIASCVKVLQNHYVFANKPLVVAVHVLIDLFLCILIITFLPLIEINS